ncbi:MAG TPA: tyrosine--tRNA ligase [Atribacter sp.]|uniref:Tyrosine--tRNA ligase n=1 Tax=Candidatus Atribacter allofermentans TaxID=1852833 RepID=A0A1V5T445_9BACT|nr:tyrosine--tRNA ligase [Atribacter sp.]MDD3713267.1 tyrosine--tRNA ligase [Atribacterota bacterium]OQA61293.1 MAG: Tyrosine--tRNA ligase [Candidatus Atribacteria bacterium ADurb.Bin276]MDI9595786.1 tyrosine--tRNA ligase [Atribacterota bacterium]HOT05487.1 tyrosine--tRNA ligase [Atribacter sp.]HQK83057.1 tyrosine--tRNA ligase [Atribacter sp.]
MSFEKRATEDLEILCRGVEDIISREDLQKKLNRYYQTGQPLIVKEGFDPSAPDIHLGHTVTLRKLRQFQALGHQVVFLVGDFTGRIGDPTGKKETRKQLTEEEVLVNAKTYSDQAFKILDPEKTIIEFNSKWLKNLSFVDIIEITAHFTVARMLEREDFHQRISNGKPVGLHEFLYPIMQAYDSVSLRADVELGGTDQRFNLLMGRDLQREFGQEPQVVMMMPLLEGTDGVEKMSKSLGNYIAVNDPPFDMFGKIMSIPDSLIKKYFILLTDIPMNTILQWEKDFTNDLLHPRDWKIILSKEIVSIYHGSDRANQALEDFERAFAKKESPEDAQILTLTNDDLKDEKIWIISLLLKTGVSHSKSELRRLVEQGGVYLDNMRIADPNSDIQIKDDQFLRVGKKHFFRIKKK